MLAENELITLILAIGVLLLLLQQRRQFHALPQPRLLLGAFLISCLAWVLTVSEGFWQHELCNLLEHGCYLSAGVLLAIWIRCLYAGEASAA